MEIEKFELKLQAAMKPLHPAHGHRTTGNVGQYAF